MSVTASKLFASLPAAPFPATVEAVDEDSGEVRLCWHARDGWQRGSAAVLRVPGWKPGPGDRVLALGAADDGIYVLGVIGLPEPQPIPLGGGIVAEFQAEGEPLVVRNRDGQVLFRFDATSSSLQLESEDLDLSTHSRSLRLRASERLELAGRKVVISGEDSLEAGVGAGDGAGSRLKIDRTALRLDSEHLFMQARTALARIADLRWAGTVWRGSVERATLTAGRLETSVDVAVQSARELFQRVRGLHQSTAGRARQIVDGTIQVKAKKVMYRALGAFKVRGDKIHLG